MLKCVPFSGVYNPLNVSQGFNRFLFDRKSDRTIDLLSATSFKNRKKLAVLRWKFSNNIP